MQTNAPRHTLFSNAQTSFAGRKRYGSFNSSLGIVTRIDDSDWIELEAAFEDEVALAIQRDSGRAQYQRRGATGSPLSAMLMK